MSFARSKLLQEPTVRRAGWLATRSLLALFLPAAGAAQGNGQYVTGAVTRGAVTRTVTASGTVSPVETVNIGSYVSGMIQELHCDFNTKVKRGELCAKIDPRPYQAAVNRDKAKLAVAKAQLVKDRARLEYVKVTYDRNLHLVRTQAVSQDALDSSKSAYDQAEAQIGLDQATIDLRRAEVDAAQVNLDYTNIVSPIDGTVLSRNVTAAQTVAASFQTPMFFLIASDLSKVEVHNNVRQSEIGGVRAGQKATFAVDAFPNRTFEGVVAQIRQSQQTPQNSVAFDVVVSAENPDLALMPGMVTATKIIAGQANGAIRVPDAALRYAPASITPSVATETLAPNIVRVWVLRDGRPMPVPIVPGVDDGNFTEVTSGDLKAGDTVILSEQQ